MIPFFKFEKLDDRRNDIQGMIERVKNSPYSLVEIDSSSYKKMWYCASVLQSTIVLMGYDDIMTAFTLKERTFIMVEE